MLAPFPFCEPHPAGLDFVPPPSLRIAWPPPPPGEEGFLRSCQPATFFGTVHVDPLIETSTALKPSTPWSATTRKMSIFFLPPKRAATIANGGPVQI